MHIPGKRNSFHVRNTGPLFGGKTERERTPICSVDLAVPSYAEYHCHFLQYSVLKASILSPVMELQPINLIIIVFFI